MSGEQLHLAIGVPAFVALIGILVNVALYIHLSSRMEGLRVSIDGRLAGIDGRVETLTGKVVDVDNRVIRIGDKLGLPPPRRVTVPGQGI